MPRLRPILCRISLISLSDLRPKFFVLSISASVFCTSSRIVRMFAFLRQLYERTDSSSSSTLLSRFSLLAPARGWLQDLDVAVRLDVAPAHFTRFVDLDEQRLGLVAVQLDRDLFQVEDD